MAVRQPLYSKEEFAQRGDEIYETQVRPQVEKGNHGKIVVIDIETGAFEVADEINGKPMTRKPSGGKGQPTFTLTRFGQ